MKWLKIGGVIFGALIITALGIDAADTISGSRSTLLGQVISVGQDGTCPSGMAEVKTASTFSCVDKYEATVSEDCENLNPQNELETKANLEKSECSSASKEGLKPWTSITREQAQTACMRADKRLPTNAEWYTISVGTVDTKDTCNTETHSAAITGSHKNCVSAVGAYDAVGNVWEWVSDDVIEGKLNGRILPTEGYVTQVDTNGVAVKTGSNPTALFYDDYFWTSEQGAFGILRGGFYNSQTDAGIYSFQAKTLPTAAGGAIGFRCVQ